MEYYKQGKNFFKNHIFLLVLTIMISVSGYFIYESRSAFAVDFNGEVIAYVKNEEVVDQALDFVEGEVAIIHGEKAYYDQEVALVKVRGHKDDVVNAPALSNKISKSIKIYKPATVIYVDNNEKAIVESKVVANEILDLIKQPYQTSGDGSKVLDVFFPKK